MRNAIVVIDEDGLRPLKEIIREVIALAVEYHLGDKTAAARGLGCARATVFRKLKGGPHGPQ